MHKIKNKKQPNECMFNYFLAKNVQKIIIFRNEINPLDNELIINPINFLI